MEQNLTDGEVGIYLCLKGQVLSPYVTPVTPCPVHGEQKENHRQKTKQKKEAEDWKSKCQMTQQLRNPLKQVYIRPCETMEKQTTAGKSKLRLLKKTCPNSIKVTWNVGAAEAETFFQQAKEWEREKQAEGSLISGYFYFWNCVL